MREMGVWDLERERGEEGRSEESEVTEQVGDIGYIHEKQRIRLKMLSPGLIQSHKCATGGPQWGQ